MSPGWTEFVEQRWRNERGYRRNYVLEMRDSGYTDQIIRMSLKVRNNKRRLELQDERERDKEPT